MGWFDDNDPMGSAAQEEMEAVFEETERRDADDLKKRTRTDPVPANAMPMKQIERPESEWDQSKWKPRTKKMVGICTIGFITSLTIVAVLADSNSKGESKVRVLGALLNIVMIQKIIHIWSLLVNRQGHTSLDICRAQERPGLHGHEDV